MWKDDNDKIDVLWNSFKLRKEKFPCKCPICESRSAHIYVRRYKEGAFRGTAWMWCSNCKNCSHGTFNIPEWWINDDFTDISKTSSHPDYLETISSAIDGYVNQILAESENM